MGRTVATYVATYKTKMIKNKRLKGFATATDGNETRDKTLALNVLAKNN